jgi:hypothetical protein
MNGVLGILRAGCRRLGGWLLRIGDARPLDWRRLRESEAENVRLVHTRQHLWRRVARELGHFAPTAGSSM